MAFWSTDILGDAFEARPLPMPDGDRGATLVRHTASAMAPGDKPAVLYVHGFVDYFFQAHVAERLAAAGYPFYAVDLRGYGRSLRDGDDPTVVPLVQDHSDDLDAAVAAVRDDGHERLVLLGHSTGALQAALWADGHPGAVVGLVMNSPWFDLNRGWFDRVVTTRLLSALSPAIARVQVSALGGDYAKALHRERSGEWDFDLRWKPDSPFPVRAAWFSSVRRAHARLARGLSIDAPILVTTSDRTTAGRTHAENTTTDSVLNVQHMWDLAPRLGPDVQVEVIPGGAHDLALSPTPAREKYLSTITTWLNTHTAT